MVRVVVAEWHDTHDGKYYNYRDPLRLVVRSEAEWTTTTLGGCRCTLPTAAAIPSDAVTVLQLARHTSSCSAGTIHLANDGRGRCRGGGCGGEMIEVGTTSTTTVEDPVVVLSHPRLCTQDQYRRCAQQLVAMLQIDRLTSFSMGLDETRFIVDAKIKLFSLLWRMEKCQLDDEEAV